jgi:hypothetical protein
MSTSAAIPIHTFSDLRSRFPSWEAFKEHLTSAAGGSLRVIDPAPGSPYAVIRYVKGQSDFAHAGQFRSVVWDTERGLPACVAPFKAEEGVPPTGGKLFVNEFVDGYMVNAFVGRDGVLEVATRTQIGGGNTFYGGKTFGHMFDDALATTPLKTRAGVAAALGEGGFVSFVVQHPEHRIVAKVARAGLRVVHVGKVDAATGVATLVTGGAETGAFADLCIPGTSKEYATAKEMEDVMQRMAMQEGWRWQGLCFHDAAGRRWRMRSPTYTMLRELRGAEASGLDRFLRLRAERKVGDYLKHYSEERVAFWEHEQKLRAATEGVLAAYGDCHKAHAVAFKDLPVAVKPAVYTVHVKWLQEMRPKGHAVRLQNVVEVVNALRPFEQRRLVEGAVYVAQAPARVAAEPPTQSDAPVGESV